MDIMEPQRPGEPSQQSEQLRQSFCSSCSTGTPPPYSETDATRAGPGPIADSPTCPPDWKTRPHNLLMICYPFPRAEVESKTQQEVSWGAHLKVNCRDVPSLMRRGFFWSDANIVQEEGYLSPIEEPVPSHARAEGWVVCRYYYLRDLAEEAQWVARLEVYARDYATLRDFRPAKLSVEMVHEAAAWNWDSKRTFYFHQDWLDYRYNVIYDDMPLQGWWPWPKKEDLEVEDNKKEI